MKYNPNLAPMDAPVMESSDDLDNLFRENNCEEDVRSSEWISIEFDHLDGRASEWSNDSVAWVQLSGNSNGSTSSDDDPWIIKLKQVSILFLWIYFLQLSSDLTSLIRYQLEHEVWAPKYERVMRFPLFDTGLIAPFMSQRSLKNFSVLQRNLRTR